MPPSACISYPNIAKATLFDSNGNKIHFTKESDSLILFDTEKGKEYYIDGLIPFIKPSAPANVNYTAFEGKLSFIWEGNAAKYNIYAAFESDKVYTLLGSTFTHEFIYEAEQDRRTTFRICSVDADGIESDGAICYYNP